MKIRRYQSADRDRALDIWLAASRIGHPFLGESTLNEQVPIVEQHLAAADTWMAVEADEVVGFIGLIDTFIGGLFVDPDRRGMGIGKALVEHAGRAKGALTVEVYVDNPSAVAFYSRCGFRETGRKEKDDEGRDLEIVQMARGS